MSSVCSVYRNGLIAGVLPSWPSFHQVLLSLLKLSLSDSHQGPSCPVFYTVKARQPTPDGYTLLPFTITEAAALLGTVKAVEMVLYPCPDLCLVTQFYHGGLQRVPWTSRLVFFLLSFFCPRRAVWIVGPPIHRWVRFYPMSNQFIVARLDRRKVLGTSHG